MIIVFATKNEGKAKEVANIFNSSEIEILSLKGIEDVPDVLEDGKTFEENAKKKAAAFYEVLRIPVLADDSGLIVDKLNGAPGVFSARYAGENATDEDNNDKLMKELENYSQPYLAKFVCCAVYYDGKSFTSSFGELTGEIIKTKRGTNGFGYDPYFLPLGYDKTTAELSLEEKNKISHRAKAFLSLQDKLLKSIK